MTKLISTLFWLALMAASGMLHAEDEEITPNVEDGVVSIRITEPARKVGYTVGDILERDITLEIKHPYKLIETSLPIVGYEKRYQGQKIGIDLSSIHHVKQEHDASTTHHIKLAYQVFTNNVVAKHAALPQEYVKLIKDGKVVKYRIPSWDFAISPLSIFGAVKIEYDMSPFRGPLILHSAKEQQRLYAFAAVLAVSLLGLLYILGTRSWLPRMGRPFARAYRDLRKLAKAPAPTPQTLQLAVSRLHKAFNTTAGQGVFADNIDMLIATKPGFAIVRDDIAVFFQLSRQVFFEPGASHQAGKDPMQWLLQFCRRCRDCERGLKPDTRKLANNLAHNKVQA